MKMKIKLSKYFIDNFKDTDLVNNISKFVDKRKEYCMALVYTKFTDNPTLDSLINPPVHQVIGNIRSFDPETFEFDVFINTHIKDYINYLENPVIKIWGLRNNKNEIERICVLFIDNEIESKE